MYGGKVVEHAPTDVLFADMKMPYTEALMRSIPRLDQPSHTRLEAIPGRPPDLVRPAAGCNFAPRCRYVQTQCLLKEPPLVGVDGSPHRYRCWFPVGTPEGTEALARNESLAGPGGDPASAGLLAATAAAAGAVRRDGAEVAVDGVRAPGPGGSG
nr:oligopeptide/dipeptide ABC transporter ATP-binding protein [Rhabdothermincola salaria]